MYRPVQGEPLDRTVFRCGACGAVFRASCSAQPCPGCRAPNPGAAPHVDAAALVSTLLSSPAPVLVAFGDDPSLDVLAEGCPHGLLVLRVDTRVEPAAAAAYHVGDRPTCVLFRDGVEVARRSAPPRGDDLRAWAGREAARFGEPRGR